MVSASDVNHAIACANDSAQLRWRTMKAAAAVCRAAS